jgi:hypothetical protein
VAEPAGREADSWTLAPTASYDGRVGLEEYVGIET